MRVRLLLTILLMPLLGCAARTAPSAPTVAAKPSPYPESVQWVREAAEYHAALHQVYRQATALVEGAVAGRRAGMWAVVLDADETIISNATYQLERARLGLGFTPESWNAWVKRREATPLPGASAFLSHVRALGGRIAIVTNRLQSECDDTAAVFKSHELVYDVMLCRQDGTPSDKNPRFDAVAKGRSGLGSTPLEVVAYVGDNILDFPTLSQSVKAQGHTGFVDFGVRYFLVPNPMYGSWQ